MSDDELRRIARDLEASAEIEMRMAQRMESLERQVKSSIAPRAKDSVWWGAVKAVAALAVTGICTAAVGTYLSTRDLQSSVARDRQDTEEAITREAMRRSDEDAEHEANGHRDTNATLNEIGRVLVKIDARLERLEARRGR